MFPGADYEPSFPVSYPLPDARAAQATAGGDTVYQSVNQAVGAGAKIYQGVTTDRRRGNYQRFAAVLYPFLLRQARATGIPAEAYWFGERLKVWPDQTFDVIDKPANVEAFYAAPTNEPVWRGRCQGNAPATASPDFPRWLESACKWELVSGPILPMSLSGLVSSVASGSGRGLMTVGVLVIGLLVAKKIFF